MNKKIVGLLGAAAAKAHGIDADKSFPFEVRGNVGPYVMHVNAAPTGAPHGMGLPMAVTDEHEGDRLDCLVTGVYVSPDLMGIATSYSGRGAKAQSSTKITSQNYGFGSRRNAPALRPQRSK
jgi:hypothetical protein